MDGLRGNLRPVRAGDRLSLVRWQFEMTWRLASHYHLPAIDDAACLWSPAPGAYTVRRDSLNRWRADWNDAEPDQALPVTIGWVTWHIVWWWDELLRRCLNVGGRTSCGLAQPMRSGPALRG